MDHSEKTRLAPMVMQTATALALKVLDLSEHGEVLASSSVSRDWTRRTVRHCIRIAWDMAQDVVDMAPDDH